MTVSVFLEDSVYYRLLRENQYSDRYDTVISADESGFIEYWKPTEPFELPKNVPGLWSYKTQTDLYEFKKVCFQMSSFSFMSH